MSTVRIQVRRGTASQWTSVNPILAAGEMGVESDTNLFKFGNGSSTWTALAYANNSDVAIGEISQDAINSALSMGNGLTKTYDDGANTISIAVDASYFNELAQDAVNTALTAGTGITKTYNDAANTLTVAVDTSVIANKTYVDSAITSSASGIKNTADSTYLLASDLGQANGVAALNSTAKVPTTQIDTDIIALKSYVNSQVSTSLTSAQSYANTAISNIINGAPGALDTLAELAAALGNDANYAATITNALSLKAPIASPTFTGTVTLPTGTSIGPVSATEIGYLDGVTSSVQTQIDDKAPRVSPIFSGTVTLPSTTSIGTVDGTEIGYLDGVTSSVQVQLDGKASKASPSFTGNVTLPATTSIGTVTNVELGYISGVTSGIQSQISAKAPSNNATFTGTFQAPAATITGTMLANGTVSSTNIVDGTIATIDLADSAVTSAKIADGTILNGDINAAAEIAKTKIAGTAVVLSDLGTGVATFLATPSSANLAAAITDEYGSNKLIFSNFPSIIYPSIAGDISLGANTAINFNGDTQDSNSTKLYVVDPTANRTILLPNVSGTVITTGDTGTVTSTMIADGTILNADINSSAGIDKTKIAGTAVVQSDLATGVATFLATPSSANLAAAMTDEVGSNKVAFTTQPILSYPEIASATWLRMQSNANIQFQGATVDSNLTTLDVVDPTANRTILLPNVSGTVITTGDTGTVTSTMIAASPALTGTPTAPTATAGTNTTQVATTAFVGTAVSNLVASAPAALDTLNELATALGNDASFSTTISNTIGLKAPLASPTFTGTVSGITKSMVGLGNVDNTADSAKPVSTATQTALDLKLAATTAASTYAPIASPTFTGTNTVANITVSGTSNMSANGVQFSDGTQTKVGVPSITTIGTAVSASTTLAGLTLRDQLVPITGTFAVTIPTNATVAYPVGTSIDFWQSAGTGGNFVAAAGVTLQYTPGLTLRTTYSSATITKVATDTWLVYGDLKA